MTEEPKSRRAEDAVHRIPARLKAFNEQPVLEDVSFDVRRGEMVAILGRSGVGKSVTLKHILGFLKPDAGQVFVAGREVSALSEEELMDVRRRVTMVFQSGALFDSLTVGENVAYPLRERALRGLAVSEEEIQQRVDKLLGHVELEGMRDLMPSDLSTGMKRAVAIARALAAEPECILYDEPTTMVDPLMAQTLGDLILKVKRQDGSDLSRGDARYETGAQAGRPRRVPGGRPRRRFSAPSRKWTNPPCPWSRSSFSSMRFRS